MGKNMDKNNKNKKIIFISSMIGLAILMIVGALYYDLKKTQERQDELRMQIAEQERNRPNFINELFLMDTIKNWDAVNQHIITLVNNDVLVDNIKITPGVVREKNLKPALSSLCRTINAEYDVVKCEIKNEDERTFFIMSNTNDKYEFSDDISLKELLREFEIKSKFRIFINNNIGDRRFNNDNIDLNLTNINIQSKSLIGAVDSLIEYLNKKYQKYSFKKKVMYQYREIYIDISPKEE